MLIFKYVSPDAVPKVFADANELSIRFGLPSTYNDPYELFLQPDPPLEDEEHRAFYSYFLAKVIETPVACFSRRPDSVVMWAHYGREAAGICLGFDEEALVNELPIAYVGDVEYAEGPATIQSEWLEYAYMTGKRRHSLALIALAHRAAYFRKRTDWQYEVERRIVVTANAVEDRNGVLLGRLSPKALRFVILGHNAAPSVKELCNARAEQWRVPILQIRIGVRVFKPFFTGSDLRAATWSGDDFQSVANVCGECGEPADLSELGNCQWCNISEEAKNSAPRRSLLAVSLSVGVEKGLPFEFEGMEPRGYLVPGRKPTK